MAATTLDGRHARRTSNRESVIDALVTLFAEGSYFPSSNDIAERAGISSRSLFRYFDDVDDLVRAAIVRQLAAIQPYLSSEPVPIDAFVAARVEMHERTGAMARAARLFASRNPVIATKLRQVRAALRTQAIACFGTEAAPAVDALCSFESYELLRSTHGMSNARTAAALRAAVTAIVGR